MSYHFESNHILLFSLVMPWHIHQIDQIRKCPSLYEVFVMISSTFSCFATVSLFFLKSLCQWCATLNFFSITIIFFLLLFQLFKKIFIWFRIALQCRKLFFPRNIAESLEILDGALDSEENSSSKSANSCNIWSIKLIRKNEKEIEGLQISAGKPWWRKE